MPTIPLSNIGFNTPISDLDSNTLEASIFSDAYNYRTFDDKVASFGGYSSLYSPASGFNPGAAMFLEIAGSTYYIVMGRSACKVFDGSAWYDISPAAMALTVDQELSWTSTKLGNIPIFNNSNFTPVYWSPQNTSQILLPLLFDSGNTWLAKGYRAKVVRAHKNFLFALNLQEGAIDLPYSYRWSNPADINGLPASWDETDLGYIAGKASLAGSGGDIVDGCSLRDSFCVYSKSAINVLDYVGGEFIWQARPLSSTFGLLATNCVKEVNGVNYLLTDGDIVRNDGSDIKSLLTNKVKRKLASTISSSKFQNSFVEVLPNKSEVWFFIVEDGSTYPSIVYIYNYVSDTISIRDCPAITCAMYAPLAGSDDSWDTGPATSWDSDSLPWNGTPFSPFSYNMMGMLASNTNICTLEVASSDFNTVLERINYTPDGLDSASTILAIYPKIIGGLVKIRLGSQQQFDGPIAWKEEITFNPSVDRRVAIRTTGKLHAWRISSVGNAQFSLSGMLIEYVRAGLR